MQEDTIKKIVALNSEFYQTFALQFSETRMRIQPGVRRVLSKIPMDGDVLDLGCGNGELAHTLIAQGFRGKYVGVDMSDDLLDVARRRVGVQGNMRFVRANLADAMWTSRISEERFDVVLAFAVLHHLPGENLRLRLLNQIRTLLRVHGKFIHSNWQFLNSERLKRRIQSWEQVGIDESELDEGDYLLDWRHGGFGLRYVHFFTEEELSKLAEMTGFRVVEAFYSVGEGGNLGLYQIWDTD